jgi:hypothetical protein
VTQLVLLPVLVVAALAAVGALGAAAMVGAFDAAAVGALEVAGVLVAQPVSSMPIPIAPIFSSFRRSIGERVSMARSACKPRSNRSRSCSFMLNFLSF